MMNILNIQPKNAIIIEDSLGGITAGLKSGARVIAITGSVDKSKLNIAHHVVTHLNQITLNLIEELLQNNK